MWPRRRQPTRLPHPWDSPGKNTGVGCHFLLQCYLRVKAEDLGPRRSWVTYPSPHLSDSIAITAPSLFHSSHTGLVALWRERDFYTFSSPRSPSGALPLFLQISGQILLLQIRLSWSFSFSISFTFTFLQRFCHQMIYSILICLFIKFIPSLECKLYKIKILFCLLLYSRCLENNVWHMEGAR